jgi:hypothetical protein
MKQSLSALILLAALLLTGGCFGGRGRQGAPVRSCEVASSRFSVRITQFAEEGGFLPGAYYRFESSTKGTAAWHEIATFRTDDAIDLPQDQVRFLNDEIGYLFLGWMYAVTTDGGQTWSVWDAKRDLPGWVGDDYGLIEDVTIERDGTGRTQSAPGGDRMQRRLLRTKDYGRHWFPVGVAELTHQPEPAQPS